MSEVMCFNDILGMLNVCDHYMPWLLVGPLIIGEVQQGVDVMHQIFHKL